MIQESIYRKDINREINGVIKADSTTQLEEEITEYVITAEQIRLLPRLFDTLSSSQKVNCVWISGDLLWAIGLPITIKCWVIKGPLLVKGEI